MRQVQKGYFSMRLRVVGGRLSAEQLKKYTRLQTNMVEDMYT